MLDIQTFHQTNIKVLQKIMSEKSGNQDLLPQMSIYADEKVTLIAFAIEKDAGDAIAAILRVYEKFKPDMINVMYGCWYSVAKTKDEFKAMMKDYRHGDIERSETRKEAVMLITKDRYKNTMAYFADVIRQEGKITLKGKDLTPKEVSSMAGRLIPDF